MRNNTKDKVEERLGRSKMAMVKEDVVDGKEYSPVSFRATHYAQIAYP